MVGGRAGLASGRAAAPCARGGVALLLVLAAVVLVLAALGGALRAVHGLRAEALLAERELIIEALRSDAEALLHRWCQQHGAELWTPSDRPQQAQLLLDDRWQGAGSSARMRLLVWDALAGVPLALPGARRALRQELPTAWQDLQLAPDAPLPIALLDEVPLASGLHRWPTPPASTPGRHWSLDGAALSTADPAGVLTSPEPDSPTAALLLSPHSDGRLNLRSAPPELLAAALRAQRRGGILPDLLAARDAGELPQLPPDLTRGHDGLRLVGSTDRWQALLELEVGGMLRRWWLICAGTDDGVETLQRHALP